MTLIVTVANPGVLSLWCPAASPGHPRSLQAAFRLALAGLVISVSSLLVPAFASFGVALAVWRVLGVVFS